MNLIAGRHANVATQTEQHRCSFLAGPLVFEANIKVLFLRVLVPRRHFSTRLRLLSSPPVQPGYGVTLGLFSVKLHFFTRHPRNLQGCHRSPSIVCRYAGLLPRPPQRVQTVSQPRYETTPKTHFPPCHSHLFCCKSVAYLEQSLHARSEDVCARFHSGARNKPSGKHKVLEGSSFCSFKNLNLISGVRTHEDI